MNIITTPEDPNYRYQIAQADVEEAKAKMWSSVAALANLVYIVALLALVLTGVLAVVALLR